MISKEYIVTNDSGIHARPATTLVTQASKFKCDINLIYLNNKVDLKSIIGVMSLGIYKNVNIKIEFDGIDEEEAAFDINNIIRELKLAKEL